MSRQSGRGGAAGADRKSQSIAEAIFRAGKLPDGTPLRGERVGSTPVDGATAACVNCHKRSGLGTAEGKNIIPPITGRYLFRPNGAAPEDMDYRYTRDYALSRDPYPDDVAVARAIRDGIGKGGRKLDFLMPRYALDAATMTSLIAYLKTLSLRVAPGVTDDTLHFATIITPDADRATRQGMLDVIEHFIRDKNDFIKGGVRTIKGATEIKYRVTRRWQLHVWDLTGPPQTWEKQLHDRLAAEPVYAVISGLGGKTWAPVHRFCEREAVPCLFPNVDSPVDDESDFYSIYFSKGVLVEGQVIAQRLRDASGTARPRRVLQVFRADDIGVAGARALRAALSAAPGGATSAATSVTTSAATSTNGWTGVPEVLDRMLAAEAPAAGEDLARALHEARADDAVVLWLRADDLARLPARGGQIANVFISGLMGGLEHAPLAPEWREVTRIAYPVNPPDLRKFQMNFPLNWFKIKKIAVVNERVQADTYLACGIASEMLNEMLDSFVRDYLVERIETMLSRRTITGFYPRLGLASGQRFASKGAYLVRFADATGTRVAADGDWIVP